MHVSQAYQSHNEVTRTDISVVDDSGSLHAG